MKEKILLLRETNKSYKDISIILNCSKSTVWYYCSGKHKEKKDNKGNGIGLQETKDRDLRYSKESVRKFQKRNTKGYDANGKTTFSWQDVVNRFGVESNCYLSGEPVNLMKTNCNLDHIIPVTRGGDNSIENLGITHAIPNQMKGNLLNEEFFMWCEKILKYNGYNVTKIE